MSKTPLEDMSIPDGLELRLRGPCVDGRNETWSVVPVDDQDRREFRGYDSGLQLAMVYLAGALQHLTREHGALLGVTPLEVLTMDDVLHVLQTDKRNLWRAYWVGRSKGPRYRVACATGRENTGAKGRKGRATFTPGVYTWHTPSTDVHRIITTHLDALRNREAIDDDEISDLSATLVRYAEKVRDETGSGHQKLTATFEAWASIMPGSLPLGPLGTRCLEQLDSWLPDLSIAATSPPSAEASPPIAVIHGAPGTGKADLLRRFERRHRDSRPVLVHDGGSTFADLRDSVAVFEGWSGGEEWTEPLPEHVVLIARVVPGSDLDEWLDPNAHRRGPTVGAVVAAYDSPPDWAHQAGLRIDMLGDAARRDLVEWVCSMLDDGATHENAPDYGPLATEIVEECGGRLDLIAATFGDLQTRTHASKLIKRAVKDVKLRRVLAVACAADGPIPFEEVKQAWPSNAVVDIAKIDHVHFTADDHAETVEVTALFRDQVAKQQPEWISEGHRQLAQAVRSRRNRRPDIPEHSYLDKSGVKHLLLACNAREALALALSPDWLAWRWKLRPSSVAHEIAAAADRLPHDAIVAIAGEALQAQRLVGLMSAAARGAARPSGDDVWLALHRVCAEPTLAQRFADRAVISHPGMTVTRRTSPSAKRAAWRARYAVQDRVVDTGLGERHLVVLTAGGNLSVSDLASGRDREVALGRLNGDRPTALAVTRSGAVVGTDAGRVAFGHLVDEGLEWAQPVQASSAAVIDVMVVGEDRVVVSSSTGITMVHASGVQPTQISEFPARLLGANGDRWFVIGGDGTLIAGQAGDVFEPHQLACTPVSAAIAPNGEIVTASPYGGPLRLLISNAHDAGEIVTGHERVTLQIVAMPDGLWLTGSTDGDLRVVAVDAEPTVLTNAGLQGTVIALAGVGGGRIVAVDSSGHAATVTPGWHSIEVSAPATLPTTWVTSVRGGDQRLLTIGADQTDLQLWDLRDMPTDEGRITALCPSYDDSAVLIVADHELHQLDLGSDTVHFVSELPDIDAVRDMCQDRDGRVHLRSRHGSLVTVCQDGRRSSEGAAQLIGLRHDGVAYRLHDSTLMFGDGSDAFDLGARPDAVAVSELTGGVAYATGQTVTVARPARQQVTLPAGVTALCQLEDGLLAGCINGHLYRIAGQTVTSLGRIRDRRDALVRKLIALDRNHVIVVDNNGVAVARIEGAAQLIEELSAQHPIPITVLTGANVDGRRAWTVITGETLTSVTRYRILGPRPIT